MSKKLKKLIYIFLVTLSTISYSQTAITNANIQTAVDLWDSDLSAATTTYGNISDWDVSQVTDMSQLFYHKPDFNYDIRNWDVGNVTDMRQMFYEASSFNQPIGDWDMSSVTDMSYMFYYATSLNQDISSWCVTNISSEPTDFSVNSPLIEIYKPVWGTCPSFGLDDQNQLDISIYPNPVIDKLFIQGLSNPTKISVYNLLGKLVLSKTTSSEINVDNLQSGIYIIKIVDEQKEIIRKFIKN